jgi:WS/DGAT/MGAT family acyltransferase
MPSLSIYDYAFLLTETAESPKHVAGLQIFKPPADYPGDFVSDLVEAMRTRPAGPPFNFKLKGSLLGKPEWVEDQNFDLDYHLRRARLPRPGTRKQLMEVVSRLHSVLLDRDRPLWELHIIEGLDDGCFAVYVKIHHAYCDGATLVKLLIETLNTSPDDRRLRANWEATHVASFREQSSPGLSSRIGQTAGLVGAALTTARDITSMAGRMALQRIGLQPGRLPVPFTAPRTKLNSVVTRARRAAIDELPMDELKTISHSTDTTLNDVIVTICDIALTRYLRRHHQTPTEPLVAQMPVSLRREDNDELGNQLAILPVTLGQAGQDPVRRLKAISRSCAEVKKDAAAMSPTAVSVYTLAIQGVAQASELIGLAESLPPLGNILISNVPGPKVPLYLWGARMMNAYPMSVIPPGLSMNITVFSYDGKLDIGVMAGYDAVPDVNVVTEYMDEAFEALKTAAHRHAVRIRKAKRPGLTKKPSTGKKALSSAKKPPGTTATAAAGGTDRKARSKKTAVKHKQAPGRRTTKSRSAKRGPTGAGKDR